MTAIRRLAVVALVLLTAASPAILCAEPLPRATIERTFAHLRGEDERLAQTITRLLNANDRYCDRHMPASGLVLHALDMFDPDLRDAARKYFGFPSPIAIELIVAESPAQVAGIAPGDGLIAINDMKLSPILAARASAANRDRAEQILTQLPLDRPIALTLVRDTAQFEVAVQPVQACRARWEVVSGSSLLGQSDGQTIQIGQDFITKASDADLAVIVAHELAHTILNHTRRLAEAGISQGLLAEFGRNRRLNRRAEDEADRMSLYLLANAGYDWNAAPQFWEGLGRSWDPGIFRRRDYRSPSARAAVMRHEGNRIMPCCGPVMNDALWRTRAEPMLADRQISSAR
ncbi:peptidase M48 family protein [Novosphingobium sp. B 225]|uniref:peptidase M48 family protein n=1 Tax=Novosphingobium sp. B 225 TaxID=1961849 RepID=UPI000B4AF58E|nr:peptidase M48 family protein [Novosphingobium sp. B 225]